MNGANFESLAQGSSCGLASVKSSAAAFIFRVYTKNMEKKSETRIHPPLDTKEICLMEDVQRGRAREQMRLLCFVVVYGGTMEY
jgi:hypothetical protein